MIELMRAYAIMARGGSALNLRWADAASDSLGRMRDTGSLLPQLFAPAMPSSIIPISKSALQITSQFLSDPAARLPSFGRYSSLEYPFPVAVKTGSSQGHRNAWTIAFSDRVVIGCWIGSHNRRSMSNLYGAEACGPVVHHAMLAAMQRVDPRQTPRDLPTPSNWVKKTICPLSGQVAGPHCPGSVEEWFPAQHTHKQTTCTFHQNIDLDRRNSLRASSKCPSQHRVARPFVVVPPQFTLWAAMLNLPQPPAQISPLCPEPNTQHTPLLYIRIRQPLDNARYIIDPTIPSQYATIALQAETSIPVHEILWLHNDKPLAHTTNTHYLRWLLSPGTHRFIATDKSGTQRSRSVTIHVQ
jgi:penicillin-binding protein 1C